MQKLPCPFCGGLNLEIFEVISDSEKAVLGAGLAVYCSCGAQGGVGFTDFEAIAEWNKRLVGVIMDKEKLIQAARNFGAEARANHRSNIMNADDRADLASRAGVSRWGELPLELTDKLHEAFYQGYCSEAENYKY